MQQPSAIIIGCTGLVGALLLDALLASSRYARVHAVSRRPLSLTHPLLNNIVCADFSMLSSALSPTQADSQWLQGADAFSCLGTTRRQAGSAAKFREVDLDYNLNFAKLCRQQGARHLLLLSALGAKASSPWLYNRVKGELEQQVSNLAFAQCSLLQPSLLLGEHDNRFVEQAAVKLYAWLQPMLPKQGWASQPIAPAVVARAMLLAATQQRRGCQRFSNLQLHTMGAG